MTLYDGETVLHFECDGCGLPWSVPAHAFDYDAVESHDDFCCPACRNNRLKLFVEGGDGGAE